MCCGQDRNQTKGLGFGDQIEGLGRTQWTEHTNKLAKYHQWMVRPLKPLSVHGAPFSVPRSTHLNVIDVTKDSKMKNMLSSFVPESLHVLFKGLLHIYSSTSPLHRLFLDESGAFYHTQASPEDAFHFLQQTNETYRFISDLMDIFCVARTVEQAEQPNYPAEGQILLQPCILGLQ
eukprot:164179-Pelagomonas_calceolata.AAC.1